MNFSDDLEFKTLCIEKEILKWLPKEEGNQKKVIEAMNYSILAGGKRLRPMLMQETYRLFGGIGTDIYPMMVAIEMIHTYSLVHDDLPAMDNDMYRRGQLTTHKKYGEAIAILAGDALLNFAVETAIQAGNLKALYFLMHKAGIYGMIGGQTADVLAENATDKMSKNDLLFIHKNKTAALIEASMMIGATMAGATDVQIHMVEELASKIGVAFQIQDDILDVEGNSEILGKSLGSDEKNNKTTYVTYVGIEKSKEEVLALTKEAIILFHKLPGENYFLEELLKKLVGRSS
jgi:geranylgeranyl diphosphate synthase type II